MGTYADAKALNQCEELAEYLGRETPALREVRKHIEKRIDRNAPSRIWCDDCGHTHHIDNADCGALRGYSILTP